jgi:hypothetical protein
MTPHLLSIDVIQVAHHFFENGIAHFTRRINKCISMGCANGEVAPFVGHNAFLRWSALQDAQFVDPADGVSKIWSESNVSEDFDMALRLQVSKICCLLPYLMVQHSLIYALAEGIHHPMVHILRRWLQGGCLAHCGR